MMSDLEEILGRADLDVVDRNIKNIKTTFTLQEIRDVWTEGRSVDVVPTPSDLKKQRLG